MKAKSAILMQNMILSKENAVIAKNAALYNAINNAANTKPGGDGLNTPIAPRGDAPIAPSGDALFAAGGDALIAPSDDALIAPSGDAPIAPSGDATIAPSGDATIAPSGDAPFAASGEADNTQNNMGTPTNIISSPSITTFNK